MFVCQDHIFNRFNYLRLHLKINVWKRRVKKIGIVNKKTAGFRKPAYRFF